MTLGMNPPDGESKPRPVQVQVHASGESRVYAAAGDFYLTHSSARPDEEDVPVRGSGHALVQMVAAVLAAATGAALTGLAYGRDDWVRGALLLAGLASVATAVPMLRSGVRRWRQARLRNSPALVRRLDRQLDGAAKQLAEELLVEWGREEKLRRVHQPSPLPVRWENEPEFTDHWSSIHGDDRDEPLDLSGQVADITAVYTQVPSGRLLVLGDTGAGKSVLALRFALDRLRRAEPGDRVPVILPPASWDPARQDLESWAAGRLVVDHPALAARTVSGETVATELLRTRRLLPILDGFDEMRPDVRTGALRRLRAGLRQDDPFVLTSRVKEFRAATEEADLALPATAAVRLRPLELSESARYLRLTARKRVSRGSVSTKWDPVIAELRSRPHAVHNRILRSVLSTPLMTGLARTAYNETDRDPVELLDARRFRTRAAIETHLLDQLAHAVSDDPEQTTRRLAFLARRLNELGTQDLAWWRLDPEAAQIAGRLGVLAALAAATAAVWWLFDRPDQRVLLFGVGLIQVSSLFGLLCLVSAVDLMHAPPGKAATPRYFRRPDSVPRFLLGAVGAVVLALVCGVWLMELPLALMLFLCGFALSAVLHPDVKTTTADASAGEVLRKDRLATLTSFGLVNIPAGGGAVLRAAGLVIFPLAALATWEANGGHDSVRPTEWAVATAVTAVALAVAGASRSAWASYTSARALPWAKGELPWNLVGFLGEAHRLGFLRQTGATYQFRHARLQERLAGQTDGRSVAVSRPSADSRWTAARHVLRLVGRFTTVLVLVLGAGALWFVIGNAPDPNPVLADPVRKAIPSACALLTKEDLAGVVPDARSHADDGSASHLDTSKCWWSEGTQSATAPNVMLESELHRPLFGMTPAETAQKYFDGEGESTVALPEAVARPTGLGDKAVTLVKFPGPHPLVQTIVRVDNLVFTVSYDVNVAQEDDETYARLAGVTQQLARTVVTRLGT
ncbi:NACHT domain-containing protein [Streptomyces zaomyceticus]|uniref:NACHT domain-containing protein n=1 Tax=Streptomyces zaomyceticus TaxID=68286 RepID=UPI0034390DAA